MEMRRVLLIVLGLVLGFAGSEAAELVLAESGQAKFEIVTPREASVTEKYAARELQQAIRRATGAEAKIVSEGGRSEGMISIILGTPANTPEAARLNFKEQGKKAADEVAVLSDDKVIIAGNNPRSVLYAVYRFLEETLSFRWFWPGEGGEYFHKTDRLVVDNLRIRETAGTQYRSLGINSPGYTEDVVTWMARNRLNVYNTTKGTSVAQNQNLQEKGFLNRFSGHNLVLPWRLLEEHPEYLALYGGNRVLHPGNTSQLCWSNKGVQQALVEEAKAWAAKYPYVDIWGVHPADRTGYCECEECVKMAPDVSTRYQKLWAILIQAIKEVNPQASFASIAYQDYRNVPTFVAPFDVGVQYAAYNVSYRHSLLSDHPANQVPIHEMLAWQKLGAKTGYRGYEMIPFIEKMFTPLVYYVVDGARFAQKYGLNYYSTEVTPYGAPATVPPDQRNWESNRMNLYAFAQALWSTEVNAPDLVQDWTQHVYGPGGEAMARYYQAMETAWREAPGDLSYFLHPAAAYAKGLISPDLIEKAGKLFAEARQKIATMPDAQAKKRALAQVGFEEKMFGHWKELFNKLSENSARMTVYAPHAEAAKEEILTFDFKGWKDAQKLPAFISRNKEAALKDQTDVAALWSGDTLYLRFFCHDSRPGERIVNFKNHDEDVFSDESMEIFLNTEDGYSYYHLAFNAIGAMFDARSLGGMNFDRTANPKWTVKVRNEGRDWEAIVALPLGEFGLSSGDGAQVALSLKRTRPQGGKEFPNSGWPDASYHSPVSAGEINLVKEAPKHLLIMGGGSPESTAALEVAASKAGWKVSSYSENLDFGAETFDTILIYYLYEKGFGSTDEFIQETVLPWLKKGGLLLVSAGRGQLPFGKWFAEPVLDLKWSRWNVDAIRRTSFVADGTWAKEPFSFQRAFAENTTPPSGYFLNGEPWESLAAQKTKDGADAHYLLRTKIGEGTLVLTSGAMGIRGGFEIFGNQRPDNVIGLIDNLYQDQKRAP